MSEENGTNRPAAMASQEPSEDAVGQRQAKNAQVEQELVAARTWLAQLEELEHD